MSKNRKDFKRLTCGRLIEAIVDYRGMSYIDFADVIREHPMNVYKIFNGGRKITNELAEKIGIALNVSPVIFIHAAALDKYEVVNINSDSNEENRFL